MSSAACDDDELRQGEDFSEDLKTTADGVSTLVGAKF